MNLLDGSFRAFSTPRLNYLERDDREAYFPRILIQLARILLYRRDPSFSPAHAGTKVLKSVQIRAYLTLLTSCIQMSLTTVMLRVFALPVLAGLS